MMTHSSTDSQISASAPRGAGALIVYPRPSPVPRPHVRNRARAGVDAAFVDAREQHVAASAEDVGGPVAVMHIPIQAEHPLYPELPDRELGRDRELLNRQKPRA